MTNHLRHINPKTVEIFRVPEQYINDLMQMGNLPVHSNEHDVEVVDVTLFNKIYDKLNKRLGVRR